MSYKEFASNQHDRINQPGPEDPAYFYPKEFYIFDNFSSFQVEWRGVLWPTSEHAYQASKFMGVDNSIVEMIRVARSAHDAQKIANKFASQRLPNWGDLKEDEMTDILRHKVDQHPYVLKKLLESGSRVIIEDSWRDGEWGWGKDKDGENKLGQIWMRLREEYKVKAQQSITA